MVATSRPVSFGNLLQHQRKAAGLTQEELASRAGMSAHGIADLETGRRRSPRKDTIELLAAALHLTEEERSAFQAAARQKPASAPAGTGEARPVADASGTRLVGRAAELELIGRQLAGDGPPLLVLAGEPGIGKTRLLREAALRARGQGWEVLDGGCHRRSGQEPFTPVLTALERHLAQQARGRQRQHLQGCGWLVRLLPELAAAGVLAAPAAALPPEQERRLMFAAVGRYLANIAGPAGTLLLLDDLQWAATDALDLLAAALRSSPHAAAPLRILAAYRDTDLRRSDPLAMLLTDLTREELALRVQLGPLSMAEAQVLLDALLPDDAPAVQAARAVRTTQNDLKQQMVVWAGGVPYFLLSCAQAVSSSDFAGPDIASRVSWSVSESIRQRVGLLAAETQAVLDVACIIGRLVPRTLLLRVLAETGQPEQSVLAALDAACAARLLSEEGDSGYQFAHDLVREVLSADMSAARRAQLHRQVAEVLELGPVPVGIETLAFHYGQSGLLEQAVTYLERAGDHARDRLAYAEAGTYYRDAAARLDDLGRAPDAARIREQLAEVLVIQAHYDTALAALGSAADTYQALHDEEGLGRVTAQLGQVYALRGTPQDGIAQVEPLLRRAAVNSLSPQTNAAISLALARLYLVTGHYHDQLGAAERAAAHGREIGDDAILLKAESLRGRALLHLGRFAAALHCLKSAVPLAEAARDTNSLAIVLSDIGWAHGLMGAFAVAQPYLARSLAEAERLGDPTVLQVILSVRSMTLFSAGQWDEAGADGERALGIARQIGPSVRSIMPRLCVGQLALARGAQEVAEAYCKEALDLATACGDMRVVRGVQSALAERDLVEAHPDRALQRLLPLLDRFGEQETLVTLLLPFLAWAHLDLGAVQEAESKVLEAVTRARAHQLRVALVDGLRVQAMTHATQERWQLAAEALDEALELAHTAPFPYAEAKALYVYGHLHAAQGEPLRARARYEAALAILKQVGERLYAKHIEYALRALL
jgi:tetratricopeptide (TPR) repeat protein/transcriptional regulator with XRE-family HTH domain